MFWPKEAGPYSSAVSVEYIKSLLPKDFPFENEGKVFGPAITPQSLLDELLWQAYHEGRENGRQELSKEMEKERRKQERLTIKMSES